LKSRLALVRAAHLNDYVSVLRHIGAPVDRDLASSRLPSHVEETPDLYVSIPVAVEWVARCGRDLEPMELGLLGAQKASLASLRPAQQVAIVSAQTGLRRLEALAKISRSEDTALEMTVRREGDSLRVMCKMGSLGRHPFICFAEWLNLQGVISVVRSVAGPAWCPRELCFVSTGRLPDAVQAAFPNTRILLGQPHASVTVGIEHLAQPTNDAIGAAERGMDSSRPDVAQAEIWQFASLLRMMVQPYLGDGRTDIAFAAEMAGVSMRTLQRRLEVCGTSYSRILQEARFELARTLLDDRALKVIDVAMMAGYQSPQHFSRAFRRFTGFTPSEYRGCGTHGLAGGGFERGAWADALPTSTRAA
jgi:AraC-like DNA-binding protein